MRCSRPGVPGIAHGRDQALVALVRQEARRSSFFSVGCLTSIFGSLLDVGNQPRLGAVGEVAVGQEDDRRHVSTAMRTASMIASKQSAGEHAAMTGTGHSPLRPNIACSRSACSVLVGRPVLGPPRCTSMMTQRQLGHDGQADRLGS